MTGVQTCALPISSLGIFVFHIFFVAVTERKNNSKQKPDWNQTQYNSDEDGWQDDNSSDNDSTISKFCFTLPHIYVFSIIAGSILYYSFFIETQHEGLFPSSTVYTVMNGFKNHKNPNERLIIKDVLRNNLRFDLYDNPIDDKRIRFTDHINSRYDVFVYEKNGETAPQYALCFYPTVKPNRRTGNLGVFYYTFDENALTSRDAKYAYGSAGIVEPPDDYVDVDSLDPVKWRIPGISGDDAPAELDEASLPFADEQIFEFILGVLFVLYSITLVQKIRRHYRDRKTKGLDNQTAKQLSNEDVSQSREP